MPRTLSAEQVTDVVTHHGEGVVAGGGGTVRFVDMLAGELLGYDPSSGALTRRRVGAVAACVRPRTGGGLAVVLERSLLLLDEPVDGDPPGRGTPWPDVFDDPGVRFNDGGCDPAGRFWVGTMRYDARPGGGTLYRIDPDGTVATVLAGVGISNGLSFAPDGRSAYYVDTLTGRVDVLDVDPGPGSVLDRRPFVQVPREQGSPDGIAVDAAGGVWVALWQGSAVHRYAPDGTLDVVVEVPARQVTCPALVGGRLFVTTSREGLADGDDPAAGALFAAGVGVAGAAVLRFGG
jgi:sugar lactone lactonase YvrE